MVINSANTFEFRTIDSGGPESTMNVSVHNLNLPVVLHKVSLPVTMGKSVKFQLVVTKIARLLSLDSFTA